MLFINITFPQGEIGQSCVENPIRQIAWRGPQNDVCFSTYAHLSSFTFLEVLSSDIPNIDNGKTIEDTLRQLLDAGLITQKMFDEKMKKI